MAKLGNNLVEYPSITNVKTSIDCKGNPLYYQIRTPPSQGCINNSGSFLVKDEPGLSSEVGNYSGVLRVWDGGFGGYRVCGYKISLNNSVWGW